jgi:hypothetical protein
VPSGVATLRTEPAAKQSAQHVDTSASSGPLSSEPGVSRFTRATQRATPDVSPTDRVPGAVS